jgi:bacteriorhodopsin
VALLATTDHVWNTARGAAGSLPDRRRTSWRGRFVAWRIGLHRRCLPAGIPFTEGQRDPVTHQEHIMRDTWLYLGTAGMVAGAGAIVVVGRSGARDHRHHVLTSMWVCLLAATSYLAMSFGLGTVEVGGREVYFARYLDWVITTPLLLLGLITLALPSITSHVQSRDRTALVASIIGADVLMVVTGLIGVLASDKGARYTFFAVGCLFFAGVVYALWVPLYAAAKQAGNGEAYRRLTSLLTGLWCIYPVFWLLGTEGSGTLGLTTEVGLYAIVDVTAKVGFGLLLVSSVRSFRHESAADAAPGHAAVAA